MVLTLQGIMSSREHVIPIHLLPNKQLLQVVLLQCSIDGFDRSMYKIEEIRNQTSKPITPVPLAHPICNINVATAFNEPNLCGKNHSGLKNALVINKQKL